jgi:outer membrane protein assembly factor BamB
MPSLTSLFASTPEPTPGAPRPKTIVESMRGQEGSPVEVGPSAWEAPPVRGTAPSAVVDEGPTSAPAESTPQEAMPVSTMRRRAKWIIAALAVLAVGGLGTYLLIYFGVIGESENQRFQRALDIYKKGDYLEASELFWKLGKQFPSSSNLPRYKLLAELSGLRKPVYESQTDAQERVKSLQGLQQFLTENQKNPVLKEYHRDVWDTLHKLVEELTAGAEHQHDNQLLAAARQAKEAADRYKDAAGKDAADRDRVVAALFKKASETIAVWEHKEKILDRIRGFMPQASGDTIKEARDLIQDEKLTADPDAKNLLKELVKAHQGRVKYFPTQASLSKRRPIEDSEPSLLIVPTVGQLGVAPQANQQVVLALARGVLYALEPNNGRVRWATRVGIDTFRMPLRLPPNPIRPFEIILVLSSDTKTLTALDANYGTTVWHHNLKSACLGQPIILGNRAYIPTYDGRVDEIETAEGKLLGYYDLGQVLTGGGVLQEGTQQIYLPADNYCVYVLDVAKRVCSAILYSEHPSGSLRGVPVVIQRPEAGPGPGARAALLLCQADGLNRMKLRLFRLPVDDLERRAEFEMSLRGWSWFAPYSDPEKLAVVTDEGEFGLYGIQQPGNKNDDLLFPMLKENYLLEPKGTPRAGRAQLVHADASTFWVMSHGILRRLQLSFDRETGPKIVKVWGNETTPLGSPLHASQVQPDANGTTLFLVTQSIAEPNCLVTAVDAEDGSILWQRQLGLVCQGQPLAVGQKLLAQDQTGSLFLFDPARLKHQPDTEWHLTGQMIRGPTREGTDKQLLLVPASDGKSACALAVTTQGKSTYLSVSRLDAGKESKPATQEFTLKAPLSGTPGVWSDHLVLPLGNGTLAYQSLSGGPARLGPDWLAPLADEKAAGHVVPLEGDDFLVTDGSKGLKQMTWPAKDFWKEVRATQLPARIIAAPVILRASTEAPDWHIVVADAENAITLLRGKDLNVERRWQDLKGKITTGPFVRGGGIGCVIDNRRLVWLDPDKGKVWEHTATGDLVGEPQLVGGSLVLADMSGKFVGLDPATGKALSAGYTLKANVAPAAAPVAFGARRLFAPLTDGTVLWLSLGQLRPTSFWDALMP